ncbi:unnamed protein product [Macrosiphum euphorbiae]|uniref:Uncharacterized protein n=1 Tax=Macrosiphum euphorbiae TaxID=13131 RepID=A0AAV0VNS6_9HEMI|nr:unnamed protein product [Macrosiphum euphorbiae]
MSHTERLSSTNIGTLTKDRDKCIKISVKSMVHGLPCPFPVFIVRVHLRVAVSGWRPGVWKWLVNCHLVAAVHQGEQHAPHELLVFNCHRLNGQHVGGIQWPLADSQPGFCNIRWNRNEMVVALLDVKCKYTPVPLIEVTIDRLMSPYKVSDYPQQV